MSSNIVNHRKTFRARPGYYYLDADFSQIEFRLTAALAGERRLVQGLRDGDDYYKLVYSMAYGVPLDQVTKQQRQLGKVVALGQSYGQQHYGLARILQVSTDEAAKIMDKYWSGQPNVKRAKDEALAQAYKEGGVRTFYGRYRPLPDLFIQGQDKMSLIAKCHAERSVWSSKVQGFAADIMKIAMVRCHNHLAGYDAHILLTVHDELLIEVSEKEPLLEVTHIVKDAMEFKIPGLPVGCEDLYPDGFHIPTNIEYGYNWGELYDLEGFKAFCMSENKQINWTEIAPSLIAPFAPKKEEVIIAREEKNTSNPVLAIHPVDAVFGCFIKAPAPVEPAVVVEVITEQPKEQVVMKDDIYTYPCMVIKPRKELSDKTVEFFEAWTSRFDGTHYCYLNYDDGLIDMHKRVQPSQEAQSYLKRYLGDDTEIEIYDATGKEVAGRINFV